MAASSTDDSPYTRLHITPLDESLLSVVIPSSVLPRARNISYHSLETFPEKRYGFVDLPAADADKLKKKLNGAVLRGAKMRVEKARSDSILEPTVEAGSSKLQKEKEKKPKDKSKKRKREIDVIPGVELEDRKIKRGWTTTEQDMIKEKRAKREKKDKKSKDDKKDRKQDKRKTRSKYTDGPECLFKTKLPEAAPAAPKDGDGEDSAGHKRKKRKSDREVVVHEFEKTVKYPSFLKSSTAASSAEAATFREGVGWVDSKGNVVEAVSTKKPPPPPKLQTKPKKPEAPPQPAPVEDEDDTTSSSGTSSSDEESESSDAESSDSAEEVEAAEVKVVKEDTARSKSEPEAPALSSPSASSKPSKPEGGRKRSSSSISSLTIKIPPSTPSKVHPLEALYKRPKGEAGDSAGAPKDSEPFSFFDNEDIEAEGDDDVSAPRLSQPPMTPFTKQDFEYRNVRSAAPTPDTAHPTRSFNIWPRTPTLGGTLEEEDEDEDGEEGAEGETNDMGDHEDTSMADASPSKREASTAATDNGNDDDGDEGAAPVSEFEKQFWESRGDLNRKWRRRRKMAAKEKRYRENKARAQRAI